MHTLRKFFSLIIMLLYVCPFFAQENKWRLPDSPTGKAAAALLDAIDAGDAVAAEAFINSYFAPELRNHFSMEDHLRMFGRIQSNLAAPELLDIKKSAPFQVTMTVRGGERGEVLEIQFELSADPPHQMVNFGVDAPAAKMTHFRNIAELDAYLQAETAANRFSGAVLVAKGGQPLYQKAFGLASKRYDVPNRIDTKFNIGSINKEFTATAIAQLQEKGKLNLDDPIATYLPEYPKEVADKVTIRQLLRHESGMGHYWNDAWDARKGHIRTVSELIETFKDEPLLFEPGSRQQYSNAGYVVLGAIIEQVSGQNYDDYLREHIFRPAEMNDTEAYEMDSPVPNLATGYTNWQPDGGEGEGYQRNNLFLMGLKGSPAGGGYSTLKDLLKYDQALKAGKFFADNAAASRLVTGGGGLGIAGGAPGCNAILESDWEAGYTVVVLSNYDPPTAEDLGLEIMHMLRQEGQEE